MRGMSLDWLFEHILKEAAVIKQAPLISAVLMLFGGGVGRAIAQAIYKAQIASLRAELGVVEARERFHKDRLESKGQAVTPAIAAGTSEPVILVATQSNHTTPAPTLAILGPSHTPGFIEVRALMCRLEFLLVENLQVEIPKNADVLAKATYTHADGETFDITQLFWLKENEPRFRKSVRIRPTEKARLIFLAQTMTEEDVEPLALSDELTP